MGYFSSHYDCRVETNKSKVFILKIKALVEWLRKKFHVQELLSSNPSTVYQMNILKSSLLYKLYSFMRKRPKIKQKESGDGPFKNKRIYAPLLCRQFNAPPLLPLRLDWLFPALFYWCFFFLLIIFIDQVTNIITRNIWTRIYYTVH